MASGRCFPKTARLLLPREFREVRRRGRRRRSETFQIFVMQRSGPARLGLAMSRKVGTAVVRNRLKRWVREWFRHRNETLEGQQILVVGQPGVDPKQLSFHRVVEELDRCAGADASPRPG